MSLTSEEKSVAALKVVTNFLAEIFDAEFHDSKKKIETPTELGRWSNNSGWAILEVDRLIAELEAKVPHYDPLMVTVPDRSKDLDLIVSDTAEISPFHVAP